MTKLLCGVAALPFLAGFALAQPMQLTSDQMDQLTAGLNFSEVDLSDTSEIGVGINSGVFIPCVFKCYLTIRNPAFTVLAIMRDQVIMFSGSPSAPVNFVLPPLPPRR